MERRWNIRIDGREMVVESRDGQVWIDGRRWDGTVTAEGGGNYRVTTEGREVRFAAEVAGRRVELVRGPVGHTLEVQTPIDLLRASLRPAGKGRGKAAQVRAPMPGMVLKVMVAEGDAVEKGTPLLILEAMKMENILKADADGVIEKVHVREGAAVEKGQLLISLGR